MTTHLDLASLATGIAVVIVGALLLLDESGALGLSLGLVGALLAAVVGIAFLVGGLSDAEPGTSPPHPSPPPPDADER